MIEEEKAISEELKGRITSHRELYGARRGRKWPKPIRAEILSLLEGGLSMDEVELETGIKRDVIRKWLGANKFEPKKRKYNKSIESRDEFSELVVTKAARGRGSPDLELRVGSFQVLGFSVETLAEFFKKSGIFER